jgi:hypothetical protein
MNANEYIEKAGNISTKLSLIRLALSHGDLAKEPSQEALELVEGILRVISDIKREADELMIALDAADLTS